MFTLAEIRTMFNDTSINGTNIIVSATNGDFDYNATWVTATAWQGNNLMINFNQATSANIRVNYAISIVRNN